MAFINVGDEVEYAQLELFDQTLVGARGKVLRKYYTDGGKGPTCLLVNWGGDKGPQYVAEECLMKIKNDPGYS